MHAGAPVVWGALWCGVRLVMCNVLWGMLVRCRVSGMTRVCCSVALHGCAAAVGGGAGVGCGV